MTAGLEREVRWVLGEWQIILIGKVAGDRKGWGHRLLPAMGSLEGSWGLQIC